MKTMDAETIGWIVVPTIVGLSIYTGIALCAWPYARVLMPIWLFLLIFLIVPPFFPFLLFYVLLYSCFIPPLPLVARNGPILVVVDSKTSKTRESNRREAQPSDAARTLSRGNRV